MDMESFAIRGEPYLDPLRQLPFVRAADSDGADGGHAIVALETAAGSTQMACALKLAPLGKEHALRLVDDAASLPSRLVVAPFVGQEVATLLERAGVNFVDLGGGGGVAGRPRGAWRGSSVASGPSSTSQRRARTSGSVSAGSATRVARAGFRSA